MHWVLYSNLAFHLKIIMPKTSLLWKLNKWESKLVILCIELPEMLAWLSNAALTLSHPAWTLVTKLTNYVFNEMCVKIHEIMICMIKCFSWRVFKNNSPPHAPITVNQTSPNYVRSVWPLNAVSYLSHPWNPCHKACTYICIDSGAAAYDVAECTLNRMFYYTAHSESIPSQLSGPEKQKTQ